MMNDNPADHTAGDICERILNLMEYKRQRYGVVFFRTRDIAEELNIPVPTCREYLDCLHQSGVTGYAPATAASPVLWFIL
ncbi:TPA: FaeA/PapI family transcriptional regulator [Salmonella enterica subsp. enterica serovar Kottbus]